MSEDQQIEKIVHIGRVTKVVKGGKRMSFNAIVVVGDGQGRVGYALSKANEVPDAISKGLDKARRSMVQVPLVGGTIPFDVMGHFGAGKVMLKPASKGTGVIAGGAVRAVLEAVGVKNILTKSMGSSNSHNLVKATFDGLMQLKSPEAMMALRPILRGRMRKGEKAPNHS